MNTTQTDLTLREQQYLEHLRRAQERGVTVAQYCRAQGLSAQNLYNISSQLARKGSRSHRTGEVLATKPKVAGQFVSVRVAPAMAALVQGGEHAAP